MFPPKYYLGMVIFGTVLCASSKRNILTFTKCIPELQNLLHKKSRGKGKKDDTKRCMSLNGTNLAKF